MEAHIEEMKKKKDDKGFTLVELLIVIVILGILATVTVFAVRGITDKGQASACSTDKATLQTAVESYYAQYGTATGIASSAVAAGAAAPNGFTYGAVLNPAVAAVAAAGGRRLGPGCQPRRDAGERRLPACAAEQLLGRPGRSAAQPERQLRRPRHRRRLIQPLSSSTTDRSRAMRPGSGAFGHIRAPGVVVRAVAFWVRSVRGAVCSDLRDELRPDVRRIAPGTGGTQVRGRIAPGTGGIPDGNRSRSDVRRVAPGTGRTQVRGRVAPGTWRPAARGFITRRRVARAAHDAGELAIGAELRDVEGRRVGRAAAERRTRARIEQPLGRVGPMIPSGTIAATSARADVAHGRRAAPASLRVVGRLRAGIGAVAPEISGRAPCAGRTSPTWGRSAGG